MNLPFVDPRRRWLRPVTILVPTFRTWAISLVLVVGLSAMLARGLRGYLAPTEPEPGAATLVVEAWADASVIDFVAPLTRSGRYHRFVVAGMPLDPLSPLKEYGTSADIWAARLAELGVPRDQIEVVRVPGLSRYRTAHTALAVRRHLNDAPATAVDLVTTSTHGRRSHRIYKEALAPCRVGIFSAPDPSHSSPWWSTSAGVRSVVGELLALGYAVFVSDELAQAARQWRELPPNERQVRGNWID